jgi:hypothetical protein
VIGLTEQFVEELLQNAYNLMIAVHKLFKTLPTKRQLYLNFLQWLHRGSFFESNTNFFSRKKCKNEEIVMI